MAAVLTTTSKQMQLPKFLAGDVILFAGRGDLYSRFSRWLMRLSGESPTYAVHTAQFLDEHRILEMDVVGRIKTVEDLLNNRVTLNTWQRRGFEVWRCRTLTDRQRAALTRQLLTYVKIRFGFAKVFMHLFDGLISRIAHKDVFLCRRLDDGYPTCSEITAEVYDKALRYRFGVPPECADPDHIHDWVEAHPDEWVRVFCLQEYRQSQECSSFEL